MTAAAVVPWFVDAETRGGIPDSAMLARRLARWQRWCRERMTGQTTCTARNTGAQANGAAPLQRWCSFYVPAPPVPNRILRLWWRKAAGSGDVGIRSRRTGTTQWIAPEDPLAVNLTGTVTVDAPDTVDVMIRYTSGAAFYATRLAAWWEPIATGVLPGVTVDAWSPLPPAFVQAGRPDSAYLLRQLARQANGIASDRQRAVFTLMDNLGDGYLPDAFMRVAARVPSITVWAYCRGYNVAPSAAFQITDAVTGAVVANGAVQSAERDGVWRWKSTAVPMGYATSRTLLFQSTGRTDIDVASVAIEEAPLSAADLGLPAGEIIPAAFVDLDDASLRGRSPILADAAFGGSRGRGRRALVENMAWLAATKVRTILATPTFRVSGLYGSGAAPTRPANTSPLDYDTQDVHRFRATPDGWAKQLRVAGGVRLRAAASTTQGVATAQGVGDNGAGATTYLTNRIPESLATEYFVEEAPAVAAGQAFVFRRLHTNPPAIGADVQAVSDGFVVEELPMETATTAWP